MIEFRLMTPELGLRTPRLQDFQDFQDFQDVQDFQDSRLLTHLGHDDFQRMGRDLESHG